MTASSIPIIAIIIAVPVILYFIIGYRMGRHRYIPWFIVIPHEARGLLNRFPGQGTLNIEDVSRLVDRSVEDLQQICVRVIYNLAMSRMGRRRSAGDIITYFYRPFNKPDFDRIQYSFLLSVIYGATKYFMFEDRDSDEDHFREVG